jgi:acetyl esterase/lipase
LPPALERVDHVASSYDRRVPPLLSDGAPARDSADVLFDPPPPAADVRLAYGSVPKQFGDVRVPDVDGLSPLAVVVHGGAWKATYNLIHTGHMCRALGEAGIATWNVEYRSRGDVGGTWPGAGADVAAAVGFVSELAARYPLDADRVVLVGHSAGGQLALWAAKRARLPVVALAAVSDLRESAERVGPGGAVATFLGGTPNEVPDHYTEASPLELLPLGVRQILVHGTKDAEVPCAMSGRYVEASGGEAELVSLEGAGHFEPIDPQAREWPQTLDAVRSLL